MAVVEKVKRKDCWIIDLDGTLCDHSKRVHHAFNKDFKTYFSLMAGDDLNKNVASVMRLASDSDKAIILCTGRPEEYRETTVKWLEDNLIQYTALFMRPSCDYRPDYEIKKEILDNDITPRWNPVLALDDRDSVVNLWRNCGIECWQVREGDF